MSQDLNGSHISDLESLLLPLHSTALAFTTVPTGRASPVHSLLVLPVSAQISLMFWQFSPRPIHKVRHHHQHPRKGKQNKRLV